MSLMDFRCLTSFQFQGTKLQCNNSTSRKDFLWTHISRTTVSWTHQTKYQNYLVIDLAPSISCHFLMINPGPETDLHNSMQK